MPLQAQTTQAKEEKKELNTVRDSFPNLVHQVFAVGVHVVEFAVGQLGHPGRRGRVRRSGRGRCILAAKESRRVLIYYWGGGGEEGKIASRKKSLVIHVFYTRKKKEGSRTNNESPNTKWGSSHSPVAQPPYDSQSTCAQPLLPSWSRPHAHLVALHACSISVQARE